MGYVGGMAGMQWKTEGRARGVKTKTQNVGCEKGEREREKEREGRDQIGRAHV